MNPPIIVSRDQNFFGILVAIFALVLSLLLMPGLANAACRNAQAEQILVFLLYATPPRSEFREPLCSLATADIELRVMEQLIRGDFQSAQNNVGNFLVARTEYARSKFWAARLVQLAQREAPVEAAQAAYDLAVQIEPNDAALWYQRGDFYGAHQSLDKAIESYQSGIRTEPAAAADGYMRLGVLLYESQRTDAALEALLEADKRENLMPRLSNWRKEILYFITGEIYKQHREWQTAIEYYKRALQVWQSPGWPTYAALLGMGDSLLARNDTSGAYAAYTKALNFTESDQQRPVVYMKIAEWFVAVGKTDQAMLQYEQAVKLNPDDPWIYFGMAQLQERNHLTSQAIASYQNALRINPKMMAAQQALERLQKQNEDSH